MNQLLTEMDGFNDRRNVFIIGATNRPDMIDAAILRPGRLGKLLYVALPGPSERLDILNKLVQKIPLQDVDVERISQKCEGYSGADLVIKVLMCRPA